MSVRDVWIRLGWAGIVSWGGVGIAQPWLASFPSSPYDVEQTISKPSLSSPDTICALCNLNSDLWQAQEKLLQWA